MSKTPDRVVIAIDPHKASWTAATAIVRCAASPVGGPARHGRSKVRPAWVHPDDAAPQRRDGCRRRPRESCCPGCGCCRPARPQERWRRRREHASRRAKRTQVEFRLGRGGCL